MRFLHELQKGKFKCPHKGCEKEFDKLTVITDSSRIPRETYYACPYCNSKLEIGTKDQRVIGVNTIEHTKVFYLPAESTRETAQMEEPNTLEIISNKKSNETCSDNKISFGVHESRKAPKEKTDQFSEFQCSYHFGYLSDKNKNESIPETCFGCPKSIDCMLSEFNKSQESLTEIKKWYS
jgi:DNA-directed RNA polymerase subunit RPC12/RpoP